MSSSSTDDFPQMQEIMLEFRAGKMQFEGKRGIPDTHKGLVHIAREIMLEFRAGKMQFEGKRVIPDTRKGLVHIARDQIIFPYEAVFEKVNQASGRVYILKFNTDDRKFFFWMQEPKAEDDSQLCSSVNYYINRPLKFPGDEEPDVSDPLQVSENMNEDEISSRAGALIGSNLSIEGISETSSFGPVKLEDLQRILSNIEPSGVAEDPDKGSLVCRGHFGVTAKFTVSPTSRFIYLCTTNRTNRFIPI